ncbi:DUF421 domain-containing protein [Bartonella sp. DGB2]|uniref:DUF421 domain-containing protein n=1 Tax=Bartonella sp. DGB2 TaxID=3388426 RepID=UPI00399004E1
MESILAYGYIALKLVVGLVAFLLALRTTGRGNLSQMTPLDLISNFVMGGMISGAINDPDISVTQLVVILLIWQLLIALLNFMRRSSSLWHRLLAGGDSILVQDGKFQMDTIKRLNVNGKDLATMLRIKGAGMHELAFARLESNGELSIIKKEEARKFVVLIDNGKLIDTALEEIDKDQAWLEELLSKSNVKVEDLYAAEWYEKIDDHGHYFSDLFIVPFDSSETLKLKRNS